MKKPAQQLKLLLPPLDQPALIPKENQLDFLQQFSALVADYFTNSQQNFDDEERHHE